MGVGIIDAIVDFAWFNVNELTGSKMVDFAVDDNVNFALRNVKIFFHYIVVMGREILAGLELNQSKIHGFGCGS